MKKGLKRGSDISEVMFCARGMALNVHSFTQGISPLENRAGVAEWQTSSAPIDTCLPWSLTNGKAVGRALLKAIARRMRNTDDFIFSNIMRKLNIVNIIKVTILHVSNIPGQEMAVKGIFLH